ADEPAGHDLAIGIDVVAASAGLLVHRPTGLITERPIPDGVVSAPPPAMRICKRSSPGPPGMPNGVTFPPVPMPVIPGFAMPLMLDGPNGSPDSQTGGARAERLSATGGRPGRGGMPGDQPARRVL